MSESLPAREENSFISPREVPEPQNPSFGVWVSRKVVSHFFNMGNWWNGRHASLRN